MSTTKKIAIALFSLSIASLSGCASTSTAAHRGESAGQYIDDSVVTAKVKAAILGDARLKSTEINVETFKGVVQLTGFVAEGADAWTASRVAGRVAGVRSVKNDIRVK